MQVPVNAYQLSFWVLQMLSYMNQFLTIDTHENYSKYLLVEVYISFSASYLNDISPQVTDFSTEKNCHPNFYKISLKGSAAKPHHAFG